MLCHEDSMKIDTLKLVYCAYFQSIMSYGAVFWGNSTESKKVCNIKKKIIRTIMASIKRKWSLVQNYLRN
jgi:hypothetical protein